jgi:phenylalanyl-tRNA synthetase beta chain
LPPGAIVPSTFDKEQFTLESREIRGEVSNGMLASGHELAINDNHNGILVLDKHADPGTPFAKVYQLDDYIIDIENKMFTHRPDLFGILGIAREIAGIQGIQFTSPDWYIKALDAFKIKGDPLKLDVKNEIPELVPRFVAVPMSGISVKPSPLAMQSYLSRVGLKPINNVVDVTNFIMMLTAQPLHAFDYDKVAAQDNAKHATITVRHPKKGEQIALLNGKTIEPRAEAIMIASQDRLIAVGGVMGGVDTEVDNDTTNLIIECANFDMYSIRKTSMEHGLFTDAVTRFNKGQSHLQNDNILAYAVAWMQKLTHGQVAGKVHDLHKKELLLPDAIAASPQFINERLGLRLAPEKIKNLLESVEFDVSSKGGELQFAPPFWRTDIEIPEDIVEEVGRLYGYDHLPLELPQRDLTPTDKNRLLGFKSRLRDILAGAGANELLTYSFVHGDLLNKVGQNRELAYQLSNAISPDLQYYRLSLLPSLLEKVHPNIKAGFDKFALFEINKTHDKNNTHEDSLPIEEERLAFVFAANAKAAKEFAGAPYYQAVRYVEHLLGAGLNIPLDFEPIVHAPKNDTGKQALAPFDDARSSYITTDGKLLGIVGEFAQSAKKNLKLPAFTAGFELDVQMLEQYQKPLNYAKLSRFPKTEQDISLKVDGEITYDQVAGLVTDVLLAAQEQHGYQPLLIPVDIYKAEDSKAKHITLRIVLTHPERTLTTEEVNKLLDEVAAKAKAKLQADRL